MTDEQVESFLAVVEYGSFSRAAEELFVTQSTLGYRISELESELGVTLLLRQRGKREVHLTAKGNEFIRLAREWTSLRSRIALAMSNKGNSPVTLYVAHSLMEFAPDLLARFARRTETPAQLFPLMPDMQQTINDGRMDFALTGHSIRNDSILDELVARERLIVVSNVTSSLPEQISVNDLDPRNEVYIPWNAPCDTWHVKAFGSRARDQRVYAASTFTAEGIICSVKEAWAVLSLNYALGLAAKGAVKIHTTDAALPTRGIHLWSRRPPLMPLHTWLLDDFRHGLNASEGIEFV